MYEALYYLWARCTAWRNSKWFPTKNCHHNCRKCHWTRGLRDTCPHSLGFHPWTHPLHLHSILNISKFITDVKLSPGRFLKRKMQIQFSFLAWRIKWMKPSFTNFERRILDSSLAFVSKSWRKQTWRICSGSLTGTIGPLQLLEYSTVFLWFN